MSLVTKNAKEKGKQKLLPKLKTILANPNKTKCPTLNEQELNNLKNMLQNAVRESTLERKYFATKKSIKLGLDSCLRSINRQKSSCVFISLSVKPSHIISLIARNAEIKDETQPVYAQPRLEEFLEEIFGIRALCMVFPTNLKEISDDIFKWVEKRKKPKKVKIVKMEMKNNLKNKISKIPRKSVVFLETDQKIVEQEQSFVTLEKSMSGDFISFSDNDNVDMGNFKIDEANDLDALTQIIDKVPAKPKIVEKSEAMDINCSNDIKRINQIEVLEDSDDFLGDYKSLTVHKIKGNPNKKPKKKRKNNKNKN